MKSFLEEYGFAILAAIVVILLIAMCSPVGNMIKTQVLNTVERFAGTADKKLASSDSDIMSANIIGGTLYVQSASKTDKYHFVIHGTIRGELVTLDNTGTPVEKVEEGTELIGEEAVKQVSIVSVVNTLDEGSIYYVEVINDGTGATFTSNMVTNNETLEETVFLAPGLYDTEWNLLVELTKEQVETDYTSSNYPAKSDTNFARAVYVVIPNGVTRIGNYLFRNCKNLTSVTIPDSVTRIGGDAFYDCKGLISITIPDSVTSIGSFAFQNCTNLASISIPDSITSIGQNAFYNCTSLISVTIPNSVINMGSDICSSNTTIILESNGVRRKNEWYAAWNRVSPMVIRFTPGVTSVGYAFSAYSSWASIYPDETRYYEWIMVKSVIIPKSVTLIEKAALIGCENLTSIEFEGTVAEWKAISKEKNWISPNAPITEIVCSDGTVGL